MKIFPETKYILSTVEIETLNQLANKQDLGNSVVLQGLLEKFEAFSIETLLRKACHYEIVDIKDNEFKSQIFDTAAKQTLKYCEFRKELLQIGFDCPETLCDFFYDIFKLREKNQTELIKIEADKQRNRKEVKLFLENVEERINSLSPESRNEFKLILNRCIAAKIDREIAIEMGELLKIKSASIVCHVRNFIEDHCPIYIKTPLTNEESELLDFLSNKGDIVDFALQKDISEQHLFNILENLKEKFQVETTEKLIVLNLVETRHRKDNLGYINLLLSINVHDVIKNLDILYNLIAPDEQFKLLQMKKQLSGLKGEIPQSFEAPQYKRLCGLMEIKKLLEV